MRRILFQIAIAFIGLSAYAQSAKQFKEVAEIYYAKNDFKGASIYFQKAFELDSIEDLDLTYKYAESNRLTNNYAKALRLYNYVYKYDRGKIYPLAIFWEATMHKQTGDYKKAKRTFKTAVRPFRKAKQSYHYQKIVHEQKSCDFAKEHQSDMENISVVSIKDINGSASDFAAFYKDSSTLVFSSLSTDSILNDVVTAKKYFSRIYTSDKKGDAFSKRQLITTNFNNINQHLANGSFNTRGDRFYFSVCDTNYNCKINMSTLDKNTWSAPIALIDPINVKGYNNTQPSIANINGIDWLFFVSDRPEGYGNLDIWYTPILDDNKFGEVINMGEQINSIDNEISPFYEPKNQTLYFSSEWHNNFGGFDIFKVKWNTEESIQEEILNIGHPFNSSYNDYYFTLYEEEGLLTSNRPENGNTPNCCNDIYRFHIDAITEDSLLPTKTLVKLQNFTPISLYFHNDEPNPRSQDTTTELTYIETSDKYLELRSTYIKEYSKLLKGDEKQNAIDDMDDFFNEKVEKGLDMLELFLPLLLEELKSGKQIELKIKGYASPLSASDYNLRLTHRRIQSLKNYIHMYEDDVFKPFIDNGSLKFRDIPFGEIKSEADVSDELLDTRNSIYSVKAAMERKIEILEVNLQENKKVFFADSSFHFETIKNGESIKKDFFLENYSEDTLKIINIEPSCNCILVSSDNFRIGPGDDAKISIELMYPEMTGNLSFYVSVFTDYRAQPYTISITSIVETIENDK